MKSNVVAVDTAPSVPNLPPEIPPWTREQGAPALDPSYGVPSHYERSVVRRLLGSAGSLTSAWSGTPLQDLHGIITPNGLHFERHHAGVPTIDPDRHRLIVHGLVERPLVFTMDDLMRFPSVSRIHFLECAGNTPYWNAENVQANWTAQDTHGLLSCCEWTGVRLADVLAEAGLKAGAAWVLAEGADAAAMARSVPIANALGDGLLAYAQNGERLRPEQGYPLRLLIPGCEGSLNIKWLRRLKIGDQPFGTREETARYTELMKDGRSQQFGVTMEVKSVITHPSGGQTLWDQGFHEIRGLAWSGAGSIVRVDVSCDGVTWQTATLNRPILPKCLTRFSLPWTWDGTPTVLKSRATDEFGVVQPERDELISACGPDFGYHYNGIHAWRIDADGQVRNVV
jgi:sulfane dehydrogenase subunit SoxC